MKKNEKGITLASLIILVALIIMITSTTIYTSLDRFKMNKLKKMYSDIELLQDKVANYYLQYNALPIFRDSDGGPIIYSSAEWKEWEEWKEWDSSNKDDGDYYILDLSAMDGIALNYGKTGFEDQKAGKSVISGDVYIINSITHNIYYVQGIKFGNTTYHWIESEGKKEDNIPPTSPEIKIISGKSQKDASGNEFYTGTVEIEIVAGKDGGSGVDETQYLLDGETTWKNFRGASEIITIEIKKTGKYTIKAKTLDDKGNESAETILTFNSDIPIGTYVKYNIAYTDMYQGTTYYSTKGWRYLGKDDDGNKLLISTGIPAILYYYYLPITLPAWWATESEVKSTTDELYQTDQGWAYNNDGAPNKYAAYALRYKFENIPFTYKESGTTTTEQNNGIFRKVGNKSSGENVTLSYRASGVKVVGVHNLTLAELNRATSLSSGIAISDDYISDNSFKNLSGSAKGLFNLNDLAGYNNVQYTYYLSRPYSTDVDGDNALTCTGSNIKGIFGSIADAEEGGKGLRPVVVLSSEIEFEDTNNDGVYEIK